ATEQADLSALQERLNQVNDLHAGFKHLGAGGLLFKGWRLAMDRHALFASHRAKIVHRLTNHVDDAAEHTFADRNRDGSAEVNDFHPANHTVSGLHGDATHPAFAQVLLHLNNHVNRVGNIEPFADHIECLINRWQLVFAELHVNRGSRDLY